MSKPSWRQIEAALIELLRGHDIELNQYHGDTFASIYDMDGNETEILISDFAKELEERL